MAVMESCQTEEPHGPVLQSSAHGIAWHLGDGEFKGWHHLKGTGVLFKKSKGFWAFVLVGVVLTGGKLWSITELTLGETRASSGHLSGAGTGSYVLKFADGQNIQLACNVMGGNKNFTCLQESGATQMGEVRMEWVPSHLTPWTTSGVPVRCRTIHGERCVEASLDEMVRKLWLGVAVYATGWTVVSMLLFFVLRLRKMQ